MVFLMIERSPVIRKAKRADRRMGGNPFPEVSFPYPESNPCPWTSEWNSSWTNVCAFSKSENWLLNVQSFCWLQPSQLLSPNKNPYFYAAGCVQEKHVYLYRKSGSSGKIYLWCWCFCTCPLVNWDVHILDGKRNINANYNLSCVVLCCGCVTSFKRE